MYLLCNMHAVQSIIFFKIKTYNMLSQFKSNVTFFYMGIIAWKVTKLFLRIHKVPCFHLREAMHGLMRIVIKWQF